MCNQSVGLIAAEAEKRGIATVCLQLLWDVAVEMAMPRALWMPYPHGYPLGEAHNPALQHAVIAAALALLGEERGPVLRRFSAG